MTNYQRYTNRDLENMIHELRRANIINDNEEEILSMTTKKKSLLMQSLRDIMINLLMILKLREKHKNKTLYNTIIGID